MSAPVRLAWLGEAALRCALPAPLRDRPARALAALRALPFVRDVALTDEALALHLAPHEATEENREALAALVARLRDEAGDDAPGAPRVFTIDVRYDGEDLAEVAARCGLTEAAVRAQHSAAEYRVAYVGFAPGFAYLDGLPAALHLPRRETPRARVPACSVAIAGARSAVYPFALPGGWHLLGTALRFAAFDTARGAALAVGDIVRFRPVDA